MWPDTKQTDAILDAVRSGKPEAMDQLLDRHREAVRRMIDLRMDPVLKRRLDASDIVQEVLVEAHRRIEDYLKAPPLPFHLWLRQMARDRVIDAHRRHRVAARRSLDREQPLVGRSQRDESTVDLAAQLRGDDMTPATAAAYHELNRRFQAACEQLEELDREIIMMRHFEQLSNSEAATALELTPQAASMRYLRAMRRLRAQLQPDDEA